MNTVNHDVHARRFSVVVDGCEGVLDYTLADGVMTIFHTGVPDAIGGRGVAAALMGAAVEAAREAGWRIVPRCSYAAEFLKRARLTQSG
jgi:predicted GNAT family acetyltransferase